MTNLVPEPALQQAHALGWEGEANEEGTKALDSCRYTVDVCLSTVLADGRRAL
jgi:hypothetical protein